MNNNDYFTYVVSGFGLIEVFIDPCDMSSGYVATAYDLNGEYINDIYYDIVPEDKHDIVEDLTFYLN